MAQVPGFTRGIDFCGPLAFIGLSQVRESAVFSGIPLVQRLKERTCGVWVVHIETGQTVGFLRFEAGVQEIFAVQVLPGIRFPEMLEWGDAAAGAHLRVAGCCPGRGGPADRRGAGPLPGRSLSARRGPVPRRASLQRRLRPTGSVWRCSRISSRPVPPGRGTGGCRAVRRGDDLLQQVLAAEPEHAEAYNSLGYCYSRLGQSECAVACYEHAIELQPQYAHAHLNLGLTLLQLGDYPRGFAEYEWRWQTGQYPPFQCPHPKWDGSPIPD